MSEDLIVHVLKTFNETHPAMIIAKCFQAGINPPANFSTCSARELPSFFCLCVGGEGAAIFFLSVCRWRVSMRPYLLSLSTGYGSCDCHLVCHLPSSFSVSEIRFPYILSIRFAFFFISLCVSYCWSSSIFCMRVAVYIISRYASCGHHDFSVCEVRSSFSVYKLPSFSRYLICSLHAFSPYAFPFFSISRCVSYSRSSCIFCMRVAVFMISRYTIFRLCSFSVCQLYVSCNVHSRDVSCSVHSGYVSCSVHSGYVSCNFILGMWVNSQCSFSVCELIRSVHSRYVS